jgi:hypothetical protein
MSTKVDSESLGIAIGGWPQGAHRSTRPSGFYTMSEGAMVARKRKWECGKKRSKRGRRWNWDFESAMATTGDRATQILFIASMSGEGVKIECLFGVELQ